MHLIILLGPHAVGKMTVGQELAARTGFKLLYNHMTIELVSNFFDAFLSEEGRRLNTLFRWELLETIAGSGLPGLVYTAMIAFDQPSNVEYLRSVIDLYESKNAKVCIAELTADFDVRIERNKTENRLLHKPTKRDLEKSEAIFRMLESEHRMNSEDGEVGFEPYVRIDNTHLTPREAARRIAEAFGL